MDYASNSHSETGKKDPKPKVEKPKIEKVVSGDVVKKPKTIGKKFKAVFFGGDFGGAAKYIAADVLLPALRNLIVDASTKGIERIIYGESLNQRRRPNDYRPRVQYNNPMSTQREDPRDRTYLPGQPPHPYRQNRNEVDQIIIASRSEAETVLERLTDIIDRYDVASLADLYDLLGLPSSHTDNKWGWTNLSGSAVRQIREGYLIELPSLDPI